METALVLSVPPRWSSTCSVARSPGELLMDAAGWIQLALILAGFVLITKPLGRLPGQGARSRASGASRGSSGALGPVERLSYRVLGVDPSKEQTWKRYTVSMLLFTGVTMLVTYVLLRLQDVLPLNPQKLGRRQRRTSRSTPPPASRPTRTGRATAARATMSYLSQMVALVMHHFFSPAVGIAIAAALVRGIARSSGDDDRQLLARHDRARPSTCSCRRRSSTRVFLVWTGNPAELPALHGGEDVDQSVAATASLHTDDRAGPDRLDDLDQDAGHQRRRLHERQRRPSVREPDAARQLRADGAVHR